MCSTFDYLLFTQLKFIISLFILVNEIVIHQYTRAQIKYAFSLRCQFFTVCKFRFSLRQEAEPALHILLIALFIEQQHLKNKNTKFQTKIRVILCCFDQSPTIYADLFVFIDKKMNNDY